MRSRVTHRQAPGSSSSIRQELFAELFMACCTSGAFTYSGELRPDYVKLAAEFDVDIKAMLKDAEKAAKEAAKPKA